VTVAEDSDDEFAYEEVPLEDEYSVTGSYYMYSCKLFLSQGYMHMYSFFITHFSTACYSVFSFLYEFF